MNEIGLSSELLQRLAGSLLHFVWQGALLALLAAIVLRFLARRSPESRYTVGVITMGLMLAAPCFTFLFYTQTGSATLLVLAFLRSSASVVAHSDAANTAQWTAWIAATWATGVSICWLRLLTGWFLSRRVIRQAKETVPPSLISLMERARTALLNGRPVRLLVGNNVGTPMTFGWLKPLVLLPVTAVTGLNEEQLLAVLAHELAHIRRHDFLVNALQRVIESVLFYHPAVWWLSSRVRAEREHCCDDLAVQVCGDRLIYAQALMELERSRISVPALGVPAATGRLTARVHRLFGIHSSDRYWQPVAAALALLVVCALAGTWTTDASVRPPVSLASLAPPLRAPAGSAAGERGLVPTVESAVAAVAAIATAQGQTTPQQAPETAAQGGAITGQILAIDGTPAEGLRVVAQLGDGVPDPATGIRTAGGIAWTDRAGRYRLDHVPPGRYRVAAGPRNLPTYYPGVKEFAAARDISVAVGAETPRVDFRLTRPLEARVRGKVQGVPADAPPGTFLVELTTSNSLLETAVRADGTFEFPSVRLDYMTARITGGPGITGLTSIDVDKMNLDAIVLPAPMRLQGAPVPPMFFGQFAIEGGRWLPSNRNPMASVLMVEARNQTDVVTKPEFVRSSGLFALRLTPGEYEIRPTLLPAGYFVKSITYAGTDLQQAPLKVSADSTASSFIRITLASGSAPIAAAAKNAPAVAPTAATAGEAMVVVSTRAYLLNGGVGGESGPALPIFEIRSTDSAGLHEDKRLGGERCNTFAVCQPGAADTDSVAFFIPAGKYEVISYTYGCSNDTNPYACLRVVDQGIPSPHVYENQCRGTFSIARGETIFAERLQTFLGPCRLIISSKPLTGTEQSLTPDSQTRVFAGTVTSGSTDSLFADVFRADKAGVTALMQAAVIGDLGMTQALLAAGADPNAQDASGWSPLMYAAAPRAQGLEILASLLAAGANPNARSLTGQTALMAEISLAGISDKMERTQLLLTAGADVNAQDNNGLTVLMYWADSPLPWVNPRGQSAAPPQALAPLEALLKAGARTDLRDSTGLTVFDHLDRQKTRREVLYPKAKEILDRTLPSPR